MNKATKKFWTLAHDYIFASRYLTPQQILDMFNHVLSRFEITLCYDSQLPKLFKASLKRQAKTWSEEEPTDQHFHSNKCMFKQFMRKYNQRQTHNHVLYVYFDDNPMGYLDYNKLSLNDLRGIKQTINIILYDGNIMDHLVLLSMLNPDYHKLAKKAGVNSLDVIYGFEHTHDHPNLYGIGHMNINVAVKLEKVFNNMDIEKKLYKDLPDYVVFQQMPKYEASVIDNAHEFHASFLG